MATTIHCDWCGERIETDSSHPASMRFDGVAEDGRWLLQAPRFAYHTEPVTEGDTPCIEQAYGVLTDRAKWAAEGNETSRLEWRLVPAVRVTDSRAGSPIGEEWQERVDAGTALYKLGLCEKAKDGLRLDNLVTLEECAARGDAAVRAIDGVGPKSFRLIRAELEARGLTFDREELA